MTKQELAVELAAKEGITIAKAYSIIDSMFGIISDQLKNGGKVKIRHFGTFTVSKSKQRSFKNPSTKEESVIQEHKRPMLVSSRSLKQQMNQLDGEED